MSAPTLTGPGAGKPPVNDAPVRSRRGTLIGLATQRATLLVALIIVLLIVMAVLDGAGLTSAPYNSDYLASSLIDVVPIALLGIAELLVITSGRGGIDLSVGSTVSVAGMVFGFGYGDWHWALLPALVLAIAVGGLCGAINGVLIAYVGFPALISTLATYYAYQSIALVINNQQPISTKPIQQFYSAASSVQLPLIGQWVPLIPLGLFTFLIPLVIVIWVLLNRTTWGRKVYAIGTNDVAAEWAGIDVRRTRFSVYLGSGLLAGFVGVYTVAEFASSRPDAGTSGDGMALPAITIAVLGGVAITGGIGRVSAVVLAALLIVWLDAGILLVFPGNVGTQFEFLALGIVLIGFALLNEFLQRRAGGIR